MKATPEEGISTQENQLMGISSSSIMGVFSTNTPVLHQSISILRLPLSFLPTLLRITYEGREGGREQTWKKTLSAEIVGDRGNVLAETPYLL